MVNFSTRTLFASLAALALCPLFLTQAPAAFQVHAWDSFEQGKLPPGAKIGHTGGKESAKVVPLTSPDLPAGIVTPASRFECGTYGILITCTPKKPQVSFVSPTSLDRSRLGDVGMALFQADFYLPEKDVLIPTMAIMAAMPSTENTKYAMYRFGIQEEKCFFSYTDGVEADPVLFKQQFLEQLPVNRPGWNRLQILFTGSDQIDFAVNGTLTSFSPQEQGDHQILTAGLMSTIPYGLPADAPSRTAFMDNLSIQWSGEGGSLPESPWLGAGAGQNEVALTPTSPFAANGLPWYTNPSDGWQQAFERQQPLLVLFHIPDSNPTTFLEDLAPTDAATRTLFDSYVPVRIDINQLLGGTLARQYQILRAPTLLKFSPAGKEIGRISVIPSTTTWEEVQQFLQSAEPASAS